MCHHPPSPPSLCPRLAPPAPAACHAAAQSAVDDRRGSRARMQEIVARRRLLDIAKTQVNRPTLLLLFSSLEDALASVRASLYIILKTAFDRAYLRLALLCCAPQTEEIEFLREELDRLRQKTFPSFAAMRARPRGNVDLRA